MESVRMMTGLEAHCAAAYLLWCGEGDGLQDLGDEEIARACTGYMDEADRVGLDGETRIPWGRELEPYVCVGAWMLHKRFGTQTPFGIESWKSWRGARYLGAWLIGDMSEATLSRIQDELDDARA